MFILACLVKTMVVGCTLFKSSRPIDRSLPPPGKGVVYIYQEASTGGPPTSSSEIYVYDTPVVVMYNGGAFRYEANPGTVQIWAPSRPTGSQVELDIKAGEEFFVKCTYVSAGALAQPSIRLAVVPKEIGEADLAKCVEYY
jgi:hypothetical protein